MAEGEGTSEDSKQAVKKGKAKQPTQGYDISVSPGSAPLRKSLVPSAELTPGRSSLPKSPVPIAELTPGSSSLPKSPVPIAELTPGRSSLPKSPVPIAALTPGRSSLRKSLVPIAELVPGQTIVNWEIQGLVVAVSEIESYKKPRGDCCGMYFSFEMRDQAGGEIRVVGFDSAVSRFFAKVVEGKEHALSRGRLMTPKDRFNHMNRRCEIVLEYDSEIRVLEGGEENNKSLLERVTEIQKTLEFCTSKLQALETEIKKGGKIVSGNPAGTMSTVKMEAPDVVGGVPENPAQAEKKIESPVIRKTSSSSSSNTTRGAGLGTRGTIVLTPMFSK